MKTKKDRNVILKDGAILILTVLIIALIGSSMIAINSAFNSNTTITDSEK